MNHKKMTAFLLAASLLAVPAGTGVELGSCIMAQAAVQSGTCGAKLTWTLKDGTLTVSGEGDMSDWQNDDLPPWHGNRESITYVVIEEGVTAIGNFAFANSYALTTVTIPDSVTSIRMGAFANCEKLAAITIPESVTEIDYGTFGYCKSLTTIKILNPYCEIAMDPTTISNDGMSFSGTIYGHADSTAEAYAKAYDRKFATLDKAPATDPDPTPTLALGDVNGDKQVNASDAARILMASATAGVTGGDTGLTVAETTAADVTKDGKVDASDAAKVLMYSAAVGTGFKGTMEDYLQ